jgi:hypothetical protein
MAQANEDIFADTEYIVGDEIETPPTAEVEEGEADDLVVEVSDDTPEADKNHNPLPKNLSDELEDLDSSAEAENYSTKVQQRISQMKKVWHDERRAKESANRERDEAANLTQQLLAERNALRQKLSTGEAWALEETKRRAALSVDVAKRLYRDAYEDGDSDKIVDAQHKLNEATIDHSRVQSIRPQYALQQNPNPVYNEPQASKPPPQPAPVDDRAQDWGATNEWFGTDDEMTSFALGLHQKLVKEGVPPSTDHYYERIDARMKEVFPDKFGGAPKGKQQPSTVVAPVGRTPKGRKVVLNKSQAAIAKRLGVSNEAYYRELEKISRG